MVEPWLLYGLLVSLVLSGMAYWFGRVRGRAQGARVMEAELPLRLRTRVLKTGVCPICDSRHRSVLQCPQRGD